MSVIFKEKRYDQFLIFLKNCSILFLVLIILISLFNYVIQNRVEIYRNELKTKESEKLKYKSLIKEINSIKNSKTNKKENYNLLIDLANYAENISYNSLQIRNNKVNINAVSSQQNYIFKLIDSLKADAQFENVELININQKDNYYFQLEALLFQ